MTQPAANDLGFTLLPADDQQSTPDEALAASAAGAIASSDPIVPLADDAPVPFGRTWVFDFEARRFVRSGSSPAETSGLAALEQWVLMALHSARYAHAVFSDDFGIEEPEDPFGQLLEAEVVSDYEQAAREAILVHDRVTAVENWRARWDPATGTLYIDAFDVVTDEEQVVPFTGIVLGRSS